MNLYETTVVIDSLQKAEDMQNTVTKIESFIQNNGGTIKMKEEWGKKRLAYEINRKQYGTYFHIIFEGPSTFPGLLEREYRLEESILRFLTVVSETAPVDEKVAEPDPVAKDVSVSETPQEPAAAPVLSTDSDEAAAAPVATTPAGEEEEPAKAE